MKPVCSAARDMVQLFDIASDTQARVVLVGDKMQHRSVAAGEPLKLLEERGGLAPCQVTEILRQSGDYLKATKALSEGRMEDGLAELDKLIGSRRYRARTGTGCSRMPTWRLAAEKKKNGKEKSALVISPTHAEGNKITATIRAALKAKGKLGEERTLATWVPAQLTASPEG